MYELNGKDVTQVQHNGFSLVALFVNFRRDTLFDKAKLLAGELIITYKGINESLSN